MSKNSPPVSTVRRHERPRSKGDALPKSAVSARQPGKMAIPPCPKRNQTAGSADGRVGRALALAAGVLLQPLVEGGLRDPHTALAPVREHGLELAALDGAIQCVLREAAGLHELFNSVISLDHFSSSHQRGWGRSPRPSLIMASPRESHLGDSGPVRCNGRGPFFFGLCACATNTASHV